MPNRDPLRTHPVSLVPVRLTTAVTQRRHMLAQGLGISSSARGLALTLHFLNIALGGAFLRATQTLRYITPLRLSSYVTPRLVGNTPGPSTLTSLTVLRTATSCTLSTPLFYRKRVGVPVLRFPWAPASVCWPFDSRIPAPYLMYNRARCSPAWNPSYKSCRSASSS